MKTTNEKSTATATHLSTLCQYIIPFGGFIFPLLVWSSKKEDSSYVNYHGKQALNFQLSILAYSLVILLIAISTLVIGFFKLIHFTKINDTSYTINEFFFNMELSGFVITGFIAILFFVLLKISEFFLIIYAAVKSANGEYYKYPLTITFIK